MRYAHVKNGQVVNVSFWTTTPAAPTDDFGAELVLLPEGSLVGPGWTYDGEDFAPPAPEVL